MNILEIVRILEDAGREIILPAHRRQANTVTIKEDGSVVTEVDISCQNFIRERLYNLAPSVCFVSEEMDTPEQRSCLNQNSATYWCLDPLDGTTNFTSAFPAFAISLALVEDGEPTVAVIHDPVRSESFYAEKQGGAWLNETPIHTSAETDLMASVGFVDFKRLNADLATSLVTQRFCRSHRNIGSCALEWAWLAAGRVQFIIHGGQKIWDYAAGILLAREAGGQVCSLTGHNLFFQAGRDRSVLATANREIRLQIQSHLF